MRTRTLPTPETYETPEHIEKTVDERGFYLYEWISPDELRMTLERDYLQIVRYASIPLAVITMIVWFIGFAGGVMGTLIAVLWVLGLFYLIVWAILFVRFLYRSYLYTRGAQVVITDDHYVSWGHVLEQTDRVTIEKKFQKFEEIFDEAFLWPSRLAERKQHEQKKLFQNLKEIAFWWGKILKNVWRSRDSGGIVIIILIAWLLYGFMMGFVYFVGIFFISLFGRIFTWMAHRYLLATSNTEHRIQTYFVSLDEKARGLQTESDTSISLLTEAWQNAWKENLLSKINESLEVLSDLAGSSTDESQKLRKLLESSKYRDIFNFMKYGNWVKKQILEPIESILLLLMKNHDTLESTIWILDVQIAETSDPSLQKPLILQKERLILQKESFERTITLLKSYQEKLI